LWTEALDYFELQKAGTMRLFGGIVQHLQNSNLQHFVSHDGEIGSLERLANFLFARLGCHRFLIFLLAAAPYMA